MYIVFFKNLQNLYNYDILIVLYNKNNKIKELKDV